tara:strand:- start:31 stop:288 length:258 start_codon:yes stop_codon:yes gene_type:complete
MLKKFLAQLALEKIVQLVKPSAPVIAGLVQYEGTKDEFHKEMEVLSDSSVSDGNGRCTVYLYKGRTVGVHHRWPNRDFCYLGDYK